MSGFQVHGDFCAKNIVSKHGALYVIDIDAAELYNLLNHERYPIRDYLQVMMDRFNSNGVLKRNPTTKRYRENLLKMYGSGLSNKKLKKLKTRKSKKKRKRCHSRFAKP